MKHFVWLFFVAGVFLSSCEHADDPTPSSSTDASGSSVTSPDETEQELATIAVTCNEPGFEFSLKVDKSTLKGVVPTCSMDPATGLLGIDAGENFQLDVEPDDDSLEFTRTVLSEDLLFNWTITEESPDGFVAQAHFPDGAAHYYHLFQVKSINGQRYFIRSRDGMNFTRKDVMEMKAAVEAISSIH